MGLILSALEGLLVMIFGAPCVVASLIRFVLLPKWTCIKPRHIHIHLNIHLPSLIKTYICHHSNKQYMHNHTDTHVHADAHIIYTNPSPRTHTHTPQAWQKEIWVTCLVILESPFKITSFHEKASKIGPCNCKFWLDSKSFDIAIICLHKCTITQFNHLRCTIYQRLNSFAYLGQYL